MFSQPEKSNNELLLQQGKSRLIIFLPRTRKNQWRKTKYKCELWLYTREGTRNNLIT